MTRAFVAMGSNLGDRRAHLRQALESLHGVVGVSSTYETDPMGGPGGQGPYLNCVVEIDTDLTPQRLLGLCHRIESAAGRVRGERWGPRTLDVDIIWIDGVNQADESLTVPHPRWKQRRFVLAPMRELAPDLVSQDDVDSADGHVRVVEPL